MSTIKKILAIPGSLRAGSSNHNILKYLGGIAPRHIEYVIYNGLGSLPHFDPGLDGDDTPETVIELRNLLAGADGIIICTPEYAFGVPGSLKNALDWMVSSGSFDGKPTALITASTGGQHAHAALLLTLGAIAAKIPEDGALLISFIRSKMDANGNVTDTETRAKLEKVLKALLVEIGS